MATQSLYRRYRPRRFGELKGQEHVVRALRDAVRTGREGQAYLFSGPRGTGKTTSARILAKVLNCVEPIDGEPCCACDSCLAVERGNSYDVHELDAASNNGVDAIRDLIEKASLGTPGRHRVYILDEVHMLSKAAEAALLKTLEEPPPHVVFVLATTDPQKVTDTIRSRTQHLHFHLLPADTLADHVRWVATDAGLEVDETVLEAAVRQGGGSARDTLSALELLAATGGDLTDVVDLDDVVQALVEHDAGQALTAVGRAISLGHDPRTLTESIVRHLRDGFLALMAPELVQLPTARVDQLAATAHELGAPALVRAIERLGTALVEMRHAPDPRILLEVALVQLTHESLANDTAGLLDRLERLERAVAQGVSSSGPAAAPPAPVDPGTGRAVLGGRARRTPPAAPAAPASPPAAGSPTDTPSADRVPPADTVPPDAGPSRSASADDTQADDTHRASAAPAGSTRSGTGTSPHGGASTRPPRPTAADGPRPANVDAAGRDDGAAESPGRPTEAPPTRTGSAAAAESAGASRSAAAPSAAANGAPSELSSAQVTTVWERDVRPSLKPLVRAIFSAGSFTRHDGSHWYFAVPNHTHGEKCSAHRAEVEAALTAALGTPIELIIEVGAGRGPDHSGSMPRPAAPPDRDVPGAADHGAGPSIGSAPSVEPSPPAEHESDDDIDLDELTDAPPETARTPLDRLAEAFPGAELIDDD